MSVPARIYSRVLVPLDGSETAEFAIRFGVDLASKHQADLVLLRLKYISAVQAENDDDDPSAAEIQDYLRDLKAQYADTGLHISEHLIETHGLSDALFKFIDSERISVMVMSTQGRMNMLRWLFGKQVEPTLERLPVPTLLVRPVYNKIIVPLDGSKWSESAIPRATEIARLYDAELILLHIYQGSADQYTADFALAGQQQIADQQFQQVREQLISLRNRLRMEGLNVREQVIRGRDPAQTICDFAHQEEGISMIVMSTHGRTGLARWLVGSVAQQVIRHARCSVTLVNPDRS